MSVSNKAVKQQTNQTEKPRQDLAAKTSELLTTTSEVAIDRHLAEWGGNGGRLFAFNGSTGIYRALDDNVEVPVGTKFVALLHETRKGFIKFNGDGMPPDVRMVRIDENADTPTRDELGDRDESKWPVGLDGQKIDPWKQQIAIPMARHDAGSELYVYVARGIVAMNSAGDLLGRWRYHPKRAKGLIPVISIECGTYPSRYGGQKPKPMLVINEWVTRSGEQPSAQAIAGPSLREELNDKIDY
jgi:hypothetical protein